MRVLIARAALCVLALGAGLSVGGGPAGAVPASASHTCGYLRQLQLTTVQTTQPPGEPESFVCPTWMASTAVVVAPFGEGATGWSGRALLPASVGVTWYGFQYNLYETYAHTFTNEVAAVVPRGAAVSELAKVYAPYNYVVAGPAGVDSGSWATGGPFQSIDGLVVPEWPGEPVPVTSCAVEVLPAACTRVG